MDRILAAVGMGVEWAGAVFLGGMTFLVFWEVLSRYFLGSSAPWRNELPRYLFIYTVFLLAPIVWYQGKHVVVDAISNRYSPTARKAFELVYQVMCLSATAFWVYGGIRLVQFHLRSPMETPGMTLRWEYVYWIVPFSMVLWVACCLAGVIRAITAFRNSGVQGAAQSAGGGK